MSANVETNPFVKAIFGVSRVSEVVKLVPGVALAATVMLVALPLANMVGNWVLSFQGIDPTGKASPVSGVLMAIVIGMLLRNAIILPEWIKPGIQFSVTKILRLGIIFVGIKLSLVDVLRLGGWGVPIVLVVIASGLVFVSWFNKVLRLPERLGTLIAAGTGICGVTAIVSTAPAIEAEDREVAYAVANITLFGLMAMFLYPYIAHLLLHSSEQVGLFLGTAVHETSQVVGAALTYKEVFNDDTAFKAATVTKLTRNLFLAAVVPALSLYYLRNNRSGQGRSTRVSITKLFPLFVVGFIAMAVLRSLGDAGVQSGAAFGLFDASAWKALTKEIGDVWGSQYLLGTAMAAVGLGTSFSVFKGVGLKPFAVGLAGALFVGLVGLALALTLGQYVHL
ncbi:MAG: putative sulfate exporter family transporter [Acidobacteriota bacterium]|nr:putative sulfate exporter family transporter [Blastocatellia bacterium]MDW8239911.1 putative sulfate exporter family transporter [Acidobacteriota bacterium]